MVSVRKGMPDPKLDRETFTRRFMAKFSDPAFDAVSQQLGEIAKIAWESYEDGRKAPRTRKAGSGFAEPDYDLSDDWLAARASIENAKHRHSDQSRPIHILLINGSPRSEHSCPGEMSKSFRLVEKASGVITQIGATCQLLDLSRLTSEYGRTIYPCKACFSTSPALCHWPCSCYPNHGLGQVDDWMNEIYPMWVAADGIMFITPTHWYQAPTVLKSMIDRLVCADGGNPDPSSTHGKDAAKAKNLERHWPYPRHLEGRVFSIFVHGDSAGSENLRRSLTDWLIDMHLRPVDGYGIIDRYIGYYEPYGESHQVLDRTPAAFVEIENAARALVEAAQRYRDGQREPGHSLEDPRPK